MIFKKGGTFFFDFRVIGGGEGWVDREILSQEVGERVIFE